MRRLARGGGDMKSVKGDVWLAIVVIVGAAIYLYMDMQLPEVRLSDPLGPKAFPALVGVGLIAGALLLLLESRSKTRHLANAHQALQEQAGTKADAESATLNIAPAAAASGHTELTEPERLAAHDAVNADAAKSQAGLKHPRYVLIGMVLWTMAYYYFFERAGYLVATSVFLLGLLSYFNRKRMKSNIAIALGVAVVLYLLFSQLLSVPMPTGILPF
jgi:putative tricarboxylic transport membrane protein